MLKKIKNRWNRKGGYKELLVIAIPLIISTGSWSLQHFIDRMFLTWYSPEAIAAAFPAGILNFTIISIFLGTAGYVSVFVAQYYGSGDTDGIGPVLWQGLYISVISGIVLIILIPYTEMIFDFIGHEQSIRENE